MKKEKGTTAFIYPTTKNTGIREDIKMKRNIFTSGIVLILLIFAAGMAFAEGGKGMRESSAMQVSSSQMMGKTVVDNQGHRVGTVERVVSGDDGQPAYVIISELTGDDLIPIPYSRTQMQGDQVVLSGIDQQKLDNAPRISRNELTRLDEREFRQKIHGYYQEETPGGGALHGTPGVGSGSYGKETPGGGALHGTSVEETLQTRPGGGTPEETPGGGGPVPRR